MPYPDVKCTDADAENDWADCDCIPARDIIDWVNDEDFKTDIGDLEDQEITQREARENHLIFNTPNY